MLFVSFYFSYPIGILRSRCILHNVHTARVQTGAVRNKVNFTLKGKIKFLHKTPASKPTHAWTTGSKVVIRRWISNTPNACLPLTSKPIIQLLNPTNPHLIGLYWFQLLGSALGVLSVLKNYVHPFEMHYSGFQKNSA